jgi:hypothetical protein
MGSQKKILLKKVNTYKKNHSGEYFEDSERSKVKRDKMKLIKLNNDAKNSKLIDRMEVNDVTVYSNLLFWNIT